MQVRTVAVIGAGTMGHGIAQVFAAAGFDVLLHDESPAALDRARGAIARSLDKFVETGRLTADARTQTLARVRQEASIDTLAPADYVIEAVVEQADVKRAVFARLDALTRAETILGSNTSSIPIATLAAATSRPDRVLGMHFMNPVPLIPLVELVRGPATSDETMATARALCDRLGKTAVESADRPGFIANRVLMPMINEAIHAVREGVGTPEAIDAVMTLGMRHPMGPLALADLIGLDVCLAILRVMHEGLGEERFRPCPLLEQKVEAGELGRKTGRGFYRY
jgi:3-hydroxybutyryl-CoA dehydrogenase